MNDMKRVLMKGSQGVVADKGKSGNFSVVSQIVMLPLAHNLYYPETNRHINLFFLIFECQECRFREGCKCKLPF